MAARAAIDAVIAVACTAPTHNLFITFEIIDLLTWPEIMDRTHRTNEGSAK